MKPYTSRNEHFCFMSIRPVITKVIRGVEVNEYGLPF